MEKKKKEKIDFHLRVGGIVMRREREGKVFAVMTSSDKNLDYSICV